MARGVNKVILIGNLGKDPEVRYFQSGDAVANTSLATSETWKDKQTGEQKEAVEWHNLTFHKQLAEIAGKYLKKGSKIYVEGSLKTRKWQDKNGTDRYTTEIHVHEMQMLDGKPADGASTGAPSSRPAAAPQSRPAAAAPTAGAPEEDDIPF